MEICFKDKKRIKYLLVFYVISLVVSYLSVLSPMYSYSLLTTDINYYKLGISVALVIITFVLLPNDCSRPSTFLYFIFYTTTYVPTVSYYWLNNRPTEYIIFETVAFAIISLFLRKRVGHFQVKAAVANILIYGMIILYESR